MGEEFEYPVGELFSTNMNIYFLSSYIFVVVPVQAECTFIRKKKKKNIYPLLIQCFRHKCFSDRTTHAIHQMQISIEVFNIPVVGIEFLKCIPFFPCHFEKINLPLQTNVYADF